MKKKLTPEMLEQLKAILLEQHMISNVWVTALEVYKENIDNNHILSRMSQDIFAKYRKLADSFLEQGYDVPKQKYISYGFQTTVG